MAAPRQSSYVSIARAGLTAAAALTLARVFSGGSWVAPVMLAAIIPALAYALADWRRWNALVGLGIALVGAAWLALLIDDPTETVLGIPSGAALSSLAHDLSNAPHVLRSATVPVTPGGAALLLAVVATFVAALATETMARQLEAPIGAIGASVALYVAVSALGSDAWALTTACYALAVVAYLVALQHTEVSLRRTWFQSAQGRRSQLVTGGIAAGAFVIALAIVVGPSFPGARGRALINYRKLGTGDGASVLQANSPLVSIGAKLSGKDANKEVFTVQTSNDTGYYWRVIALDQFSQNEWGLSDEPAESASRLDGPTHLKGTVEVHQDVQLGPIDATWLPAAYRPVDISLHGASIHPSTNTLFIGSRSMQGVAYSVDSEVYLPDNATLESVTDADLEPMLRDTALPHNFPAEAHNLAVEKTAGAKTPFDKAAALEAFFQSDLFHYSQDVKLGSGEAALHTFLFVTHTGFCEQFAAAYAELARSIGLPTRVAVGYQSEAVHADGKFHVANRDAHAWPEVWLGPKVGWYAFEPTKSRFDSTTGRGDKNSAGGQNGSATTTTTSPTSGSGSTPSTTHATPTTTKTPGKVAIGPPPGTKPPSHTRQHVVTGVLVAIAILAALLLIALSILVYAALRRTRRRRTDPDARARVLGAWTEALECLTAAGVERRPSATSIEFALRQAPAHGAGAAGPPLMDLARLHTAAMYAPDPPSSEEADAAWTYVDAISAAIRSTVSRGDRWKTRLRAVWPRSGGFRPEAS